MGCGCNLVIGVCCRVFLFLVVMAMFIMFILYNVGGDFSDHWKAIENAEDDAVVVDLAKFAVKELNKLEMKKSNLVFFSVCEGKYKKVFRGTEYRLYISTDSGLCVATARIGLVFGRANDKYLIAFEC